MSKIEKKNFDNVRAKLLKTRAERKLEKLNKNTSPLVINEKKQRKTLLTKTESISVLLTEVEQLKTLKSKVTKPAEFFYPTKSDLYRAGINILLALDEKEVIEIIKSLKEE